MDTVLQILHRAVVV